MYINTMGIGTILSACILMSIGLVIKEKQIMEDEKCSQLLRILCIVISFTVLSLAYIYVEYNEINISFGMNQYGNPVLLIICAVAGWTLVYQIAYFLNKLQWSRRIFIYLGKNTIPIIILHFLSFKLVSLIQIMIYKEPISYLSSFPVLHYENSWWIAYCIVGVVVPLLSNMGYQKLKKVFKG